MPHRYRKHRQEMKIFQTDMSQKSLEKSPSTFYEKLSQPIPPKSKSVQDFYEYMFRGNF